MTRASVSASDDAGGSYLRLSVGNFLGAGFWFAVWHRPRQ
jgi:hypothetical protein